MSERYCAWISIGGRIERPELDRLIEEISQSCVGLNWGEPLFKPKDADELLNARQDGLLWLCDEEARHGEFPELEETCRTLGLVYQRFCEAWCGYDAEIIDWRSGMTEPLIRTCSNEDSDIVLVDAVMVKEALAALEVGQTQQAIDKLRCLCPQIPDLPPFEIIETT